MRQDTRMGAVVVATATALSFVALTAMAQGASDYAQVCRSINGGLACSSVARSSIGSGSTRPYEQWEDGSPARGFERPGIASRDRSLPVPAIVRRSQQPRRIRPIITKFPSISAGAEDDGQIVLSRVLVSPALPAFWRDCGISPDEFRGR